jgi:hypothetical protein
MCLDYRLGAGDQHLRRQQKREDDDKGRDETKNFSHGKKAQNGR